MRLIPTHCDRCARSQLVGQNEIAEGAVTCSECGSAARPFPGESYTPEDVALFDELATAVREASLIPLVAEQLLLEFKAHRVKGAGRGVERLAQMLSSLGSLEEIAGRRYAGLQKLDGMLATLLGAIASSRSTSGFMTSVDAPLRKHRDG